MAEIKQTCLTFVKNIMRIIKVNKNLKIKVFESLRVFISSEVVGSVLVLEYSFQVMLYIQKSEIPNLNAFKSSCISHKVRVRGI